MSFEDTLGIAFTLRSVGRMEAVMEIDDARLRSLGIVGSGVLAAFLETVASHGATMMSDLAVERPFGVEVHLRYLVHCVEGKLKGEASLDRTERNKQYWSVAAYDGEGALAAEGEVVCKVVSLKRLAEKGINVPEVKAGLEG